MDRITPRRVALLAAVVTMAASGWYVFVYLARWEWNRALVSGIIFLAAEVGLIGALIIERAARLDRRLDRLERDGREPDPRVRQRLRESAPPPSEPFAWLAKSIDRTNVFVPILLGAGVLVSAIAWLVERLARATARPVMERGLARQLSILSLPEHTFVGEHDTATPIFTPGP